MSSTLLCPALYYVQHITVSNTLLCPTLYCVQHIIVSSTLLCPTKYCIHTYPKGLLFSFHISTCCGRIMLRLRSTSVQDCRKFADINYHAIFCKIYPDISAELLSHCRRTHNHYKKLNSPISMQSTHVQYRSLRWTSKV